jgi:hypothetical protein
MHEGFCFLGFFAFFSCGHTLHGSICVLPMLTMGKKGKISSEAESFMHMKIKISYTREDGHVGRNM